MAASKTNAYKSQKRKYYKAITREGMFVADFVKTKYPKIYQEAATMYNIINQKHSNKPNIRKTLEYRQWKNQIAKENNMPVTPIPRQRNMIYSHMEYPNMQIENPGEIPNIPDETTTSTTENTVPQSPSPLKDKRLAGNQMELKIPLIQFPPLTQRSQPAASPAAVVEEDQGILTSAVQDITMGESHQLEVINPSLFNEIPTEMMDNLIRELQRDPNLKSIMEEVETSMEEVETSMEEVETSMEEIIEEEIIGLTVDIPELEDPLEEESVFW